MFYSDADNWSYEERGEGFVNALKKAGYECTWSRWHRSPDFVADREVWKRKRKWLVAEMKCAPKPLAVFAANDQQALDVLESCESIGIAIPEQSRLLARRIIFWHRTPCTFPCRAWTPIWKLWVIAGPNCWID
jgi:DNA-binding LacI/PurR family transcriptional regulator